MERLITVLPSVRTPKPALPRRRILEVSYFFGSNDPDASRSHLGYGPLSVVRTKVHRATGVTNYPGAETEAYGVKGSEFHAIVECQARDENFFYILFCQIFR